MIGTPTMMSKDGETGTEVVFGDAVKTFHEQVLKHSSLRRRPPTIANTTNSTSLVWLYMSRRGYP
jgi:hypothetical protein